MTGVDDKQGRNAVKPNDSTGDNWQGVVEDWSGDKQAFDMRLLRKVMFVVVSSRKAMSTFVVSGDMYDWRG